jgi:hypothetical protein
LAIVPVDFWQHPTGPTDQERSRSADFADDRRLGTFESARSSKSADRQIVRLFHAFGNAQFRGAIPKRVIVIRAGGGVRFSRSQALQFKLVAPLAPGQILHNG